MTQSDQQKNPAAQNAAGTEARTRGLSKKTIAIISGAALITAGTGGYAYHHHQQFQQAQADCATSRENAVKAQTAWEKLLKADATTSALAVTDKQVADATLPATLKTSAETKVDATIAECEADSIDAYKAITERNEKTTASYKKATETLTKTVKLVEASKDEKTLNDAKGAFDKTLAEAKKLLTDSDGKVADNATRDALGKAIDETGKTDAGDAKKLTDATDKLAQAMKKVNDSISAKTQADEQAAAEAAAAAQSAGSGYAGTGGGYAQSYNGYSGSGYTGYQQTGGSTGSSQSTSGSTGSTYEWWNDKDSLGMSAHPLYGDTWYCDTEGNSWDDYGNMWDKDGNKIK